MKSVIHLPVRPRSVVLNPSAGELRELVERMANARPTRFGNLNVRTRVTARSKGSTYIATDRPREHSDQTMSRADFGEIARRRDAYIAEREMVVVNGFIGNDRTFRVPARLIVESRNANIAAMQRQLYYTEDPSVMDEDFEPRLTVIYTPNLTAPGYPDDRVIAVDLESGITRVLNSDYFGESKKGGLRMWNKIVYDRGGLALHAGCKVIPVGEDGKVALIIGLSGTTVSQDDAGEVDFFDTSYTGNGRATFPMSRVKGAADARDLGRADILLILNRNENIIPAAARLHGAQAAAFFMLGETQGTSAGGKEEAGKSLRVPGTNPFFPLRHAQQGNRMKGLLAGSDLVVYLLNTGRVGGGEDDERSRKIRIPHTGAIVKAIAEGTIHWTHDPDFGYEVAESVPGIEGEDEAILRPRRLYQSQDRLDEYERLVQRLRRERVEHLKTFEDLDRDLIEGLG